MSDEQPESVRHLLSLLTSASTWMPEDDKETRWVSDTRIVVQGPTPDDEYEGVTVWTIEQETADEITLRHAGS